MQHFLFGDIIKDGWKITIHNKKLWWFGLFIGGGFAGMIPDFTKLDDKNFSFSGLSDLIQNLLVNLWIIFAVGGVFVLLALAIWLLSLACRAAILQGLVKIKNGEAYKFWALFRSGERKIWRLLWLQIILGIPTLVLLILGVCAVPWTDLEIVGIRWWLLLPAIALMFGYTVFVALFGHYAYCFAVIEDEPAWKAIRSGFGILKNNFGNVLVVALISWGLTMATVLGVFVVIFCLALPFVLLGLIALFISSWLMIGVICLAAVCFLGVVLVLRGAISIYFQSYFTNAYWELKK